jgi:predicted metalloprotease with PDZ domain
VRLSINAPAGWRIINAANERADQREWQFPNYDILIDTPTEIAPDFTVDEFKVDGKTYRVMVHSFGDEKNRRPALVQQIEKLVRAETALMGTPDYDSYLFMMHFDPTAPRGDGMEHLASTQIISRSALGEGDTLADAVDTASHEFFHVWNVKRLRPVELGPWDFTRPVNTRSLWIAEGLTNYYGNLMQRRAGLWTDEQYLRALARAIGFVENAPGNRLTSAEEASLIASFIDRTPHYQRTNLTETTVSYYAKGEVIGIVLDLLIRGKSGGRASLDDVMRRMYEEFYVRSAATTYYLRGRGYTGADFERAVSEAARTDMSEFFARHVRGTQTLPYDEAFTYVGLRLAKTPASPVQTPNTGQTQPRQDYRLEELPNAPAEARARRAAWLKGQ